MREVSYTIWEKDNELMPTTWGADWDNFSTANCFIITLDPSKCWIHEAVIVTIYDMWNVNDK